MSSRQSLDPVAQPEEEGLSANGEGDELMEEAEEGYTSSTPTSTLTWIAWFCSLPGHEYFCEVAEDFIEDDFNLTGLSPYVPFWKEALEMVLDVDPDEDSSKIPDVSIVEQSAEILYGLVHARYILTRQGLQAMVEKYEAGMFGSCPRVYCMSTHVVPCGRTDLPSLENVKLYCPNCHDIYTPPSSRFQSIDAAYFGTTFPHVFFSTAYPELASAPFYSPSVPGSPLPPVGASTSATQINPNPFGGQKRAAGHVYTPRIYGFKVSERAKSGPRMQWLRRRPETVEELDKVDWRGRWIDDEDDDAYGSDDVDDGEDRPMEDFDPDAADEDDDEEEEEEAEDDHMPPMGGGGVYQGRQHLGSAAAESPQPLASASVTSSMISSAMSSLLSGGGKVKAVKQWTPPVDTWARTAQV